jgi:hypothetical protein
LTRFKYNATGVDRRYEAPSSRDIPGRAKNPS